MPINKIKRIIATEPINPSVLAAEINSIDHFELARLLHQLSTDGKVLVFNKLQSDIKRQEVLYETDIDSRQEIQNSLDKK